MKFAASVLGLAFVATATASHGQTPATSTEQTTVETFRINTNERQYASNIQETLSSSLDRNTVVRYVYLPGQEAMVVKGTAEQVALARKILSEIDRPARSYRLTYTVTDSENGRTIGSRHFSIIVVAGQRTTMKQGSKVPVLTGSYDTDKSAAQTQFTYLDVGLNFDVTLEELTTGLRLKSKAEQSSIAEEKSTVGPGDPIVRQTVIEGIATLIPGKPIILGSLDIPGSTRHTDLEVVAELIK